MEGEREREKGVKIRGGREKGGIAGGGGMERMRGEGGREKVIVGNGRERGKDSGRAGSMKGIEAEDKE